MKISDCFRLNLVDIGNQHNDRVYKLNFKYNIIDNEQKDGKLKKKNTKILMIYISFKNLFAKERPEHHESHLL